MSQLSFSFQTDVKTDLFCEENFLLLAQNSVALNFFKKFFAQQNFSQAQFLSCILQGASGCGKSHLLHIFAKKVAAEFLEKDKIGQTSLANFFQANQFYILQDIDEIADEELLLRLINLAFEAQAFLVLSSKITPQFQLKDLASRLKNIFTVEIKNPDLEAIKQLLVNGFSRRQIKLSRQVIDFIADNIERSYEAITAAIKLVEFHVQESGKNIALADVKIFFK